jgi:cytochrome c-type biogenesis protein CcmH/NrfG
VHPDYANGWDSLGEALAASGDADGAIAAYERAMRLEPSDRVREILSRLRHR